MKRKRIIGRRNFLSKLALGGSLFFYDNLWNTEPSDAALVDPRDRISITKLDIFEVLPRWVFLKIHTDAGIVGLGEPIVEGRPKTTIAAVKEIEPYLIGKDPRKVVHHWQAIYRNAFYRGGPILTSALSGIDQALWDIKGKALGVPVYELFGGPTRDRIKVYAIAATPEMIRIGMQNGFTAFKEAIPYNVKQRAARYVETPGFVERVVEWFRSLRDEGGQEVDIAVDFHGSITPQTGMLLIKALEPYQPFFIEEPIQCQNVDVMADMAKKTHIPIATGERIFTKWGFREILEKGAATVLQPDLSHAGGITECRFIASMAESYYAAIAPHCPLGPISLASGIQLDASIPNFLCQEQQLNRNTNLSPVLGEGYIKKPFVVKDGYIPLPTEPGLGIELDEDKLADKVNVERKRSSRGQRMAEDGSVVDW
ncbi:galactonate dehydratase [Candidatus Latescibacterota bacterium]